MLMLKKNIPTVIVFLVLLLSAFVYFFSNNKGTLSSKVADFAIKDLSLVNKIVVRNGNAVFTLNINQDSWYYNSSFPVKPSLMSLCYRIFSQVEIKSPLNKESAVNTSEKLKKSGTDIKLCNDEKIVKEYYIWADTLTRNTYMMMADKTTPFIVTVPSMNGNFAALFLQDSAFWRDLTILHYSPKQIMSIQVKQSSNEKQSFKLEMSRSGKIYITDYKSNKIQKFNIDAVGAYLCCFKEVKGTAFIENNSELFLKTSEQLPLFIISVSDFEGNVKNLKIFLKENKNNPASKSEKNVDKNYCLVLINDKELLVAKYIEIDPLTRDLDFFLQK